MRILAVVVCLAASAPVWADGTLEVEFTVGWDGNRPVGWEEWSVESRAYHEVRLERERTDFVVWFDSYQHEHPDTVWNQEQSFGLLERSVNAGLPFDVSRDLAHTMVAENIEHNHAHEFLRAAAQETVAAQVEDADPSDDEEEYRNLGQWVKAQVHSGLKGQDLAAAIHARTAERRERKAAEKAAPEEGRDTTRGRHDPTAQPDADEDSHDQGKSGDQGHGKGKDNDKGKGKGKNK